MARVVSEWRDAEARTRGVFREINEQIRKLDDMFDQDGREETFVCECGNGACTKKLTPSPAEYEAVRAHARRFLIARDHENPEIECVVDQTRHYAVVETFVGDASRIAEETDPRVPSGSR